MLIHCYGSATSTIQTSRFHASDAKYVEYSNNTLEKKIKSGMITEDDAALIREFVAEARAISQISNSRAFKLHVVLTRTEGVCRSLPYKHHI